MHCTVDVAVRFGLYRPIEGYSMPEALRFLMRDKQPETA
jgi:hypothetical protein